MPPTGQAGRRSRHGEGERELEGLVRSVVEECESVGANDGGGDGGEVVVEEGLRGGAAGAVDGGVVDAGEADGLGGVAKEASGGGVAGAGRLGDEKVHAVAFGDTLETASE